MEISVVMPCLNEAGAIASCVGKAAAVFKDNNLEGEIIVADNGSTDNSVEIAKKMGARVVVEKARGYGRAYQTGLPKGSGDILVTLDADCTYPLDEIEDLVNFMIQYEC